MTLTASAMLPLGTPAPGFTLPEPASGKSVALRALKPAQATLVMFICNHCPYVKHLLGGLVQLGRDYADRNVNIVAISSNDADGYPEDAPARMAELARRLDFPFPYLHDASQDIANAYGATCTPDFFLFDSGVKLVYRGQFDDSRPGNGRPVTGGSLRAALDALLAGTPVDASQIPSVGCNIKWKRT